jgi:hypothetical protein
MLQHQLPALCVSRRHAHNVTCAICGTPGGGGGACGALTLLAGAAVLATTSLLARVVVLVVRSFDTSSRTTGRDARPLLRCAGLRADFELRLFAVSSPFSSSSSMSTTAMLDFWRTSFAAADRASTVSTGKTFFLLFDVLCDCDDCCSASRSVFSADATSAQTPRQNVEFATLLWTVLHCVSNDFAFPSS